MVATCRRNRSRKRAGSLTASAIGGFICRSCASTCGFPKIWRRTTSGSCAGMTGAPLADAFCCSMSWRRRTTMMSWSLKPTVAMVAPCAHATNFPSRKRSWSGTGMLNYAHVNSARCAQNAHLNEQKLFEIL